MKLDEQFGQLTLFPPEQPTLFEFPADTRRNQTMPVADWLLDHLVQHYLEKFLDPDRDPRLNREFDTLGLAIMRVVSAYNIVPRPSILEQMEWLCKELEKIDLFDAVPFAISLQILHRPYRGFACVLTDLDCGNSRVRGYALEIAWLIRKRVQIRSYPDPYFVRRLLKSVSDTIFHWDMSLVLARSYFASNEDFFRFAERYTPPDDYFVKQYRERIDWAKGDQIRSTHNAAFLSRELSVTHLINETLLSLPQEPLKSLSL